MLALVKVKNTVKFRAATHKIYKKSEQISKNGVKSQYKHTPTTQLILKQKQESRKQLDETSLSLRLIKIFLIFCQSKNHQTKQCLYRVIQNVLRKMKPRVDLN